MFSLPILFFTIMCSKPATEPCQDTLGFNTRVDGSSAKTSVSPLKMDTTSGAISGSNQQSSDRVLSFARRNHAKLAKDEALVRTGIF